MHGSCSINICRKNKFLVLSMRGGWLKKLEGWVGIWIKPMKAKYLWPIPSKRFQLTFTFLVYWDLGYSEDRFAEISRQELYPLLLVFQCSQWERWAVNNGGPLALLKSGLQQPCLPSIPSSHQSISTIHPVCTCLGGDENQHLPSKRLSSGVATALIFYVIQSICPFPLPYTLSITTS